MDLRILYLRTVYWFNLSSGGSVGHTAGVINAFMKKIDLTVVSNDSLPGVIPPVRIIKPFRIELFSNEYSELIYSLVLKKKLKSIISNIDVVYQRYSGFSFIGCWIAKEHNKIFVLEFNSSDVWKLKNWSGEKNAIIRISKILVKKILFLPIVKRIEKYNLSNASLIVVVSKVLKNQLTGMGIPESKILVNPNGVDVNQYCPTVLGDKIRAKYLIKGQEIVLGFIGTFGQWHGVIEMAKAIVLFFNKNEYRDVKFLLVGNGNLWLETRDIISKAGLDEMVIFVGQIPQEQGPSYLAACDILLSPHISNPDGTEFFGSPTKLFEYMAMGKAIIASNLNQIGEILEHKQNAMLVEPGNIIAMVDAMHQLILDENLRKKLGNNARKHVIENYTWDVHVENILAKVKNNG